MTILAKNDKDVSGEFLNVSITHNITDLTYLHAHMQNGLFFHEIKKPEISEESQKLYK